MKFLVDTNILVRLSASDSPLRPACKHVLGQLIGRGDMLFGCAQVMIEFWTVATRPKHVNGLGLTPAEAEAALRDAEQMLTFLPEPPDIAVRWRLLAQKHNVRGKQAHDTRLAAFMDAHGLTNLLTLNGADFTRFTQLTCLSPEAFQPKASPPT